MKSIFSSIICCLLFIVVHGQQTIKGKIIDKQTELPLPGIIISIDNTEISTTSDEKGYFEISARKESGQLHISGLGFTPVSIKAPPSDKLVVITLEANQNALNEVTVTGYQTNRRLVETPGSITQLSAKEIQRYSNTDLMPALNTIPGVKMESYNFGDYRLSIRGSLLRSPWSVRNVKMYWNDIPLTSAGGTNPLHIIDPGIISSLEVLKGPAGSMYGAGTGGVLLFKSARATFEEKSMEAGITGGSYGMYRANLTSKVSTANSNIVASYIRQHNDGYREQLGFDQESINIMASFYPSEKQTVSFFALHNKSDIDLAGGLTEQQFKEDPKQAVAFNKEYNTFINTKTTNVGLSHKYDWNNKFSNVTSVFTNYYYMDHSYGNSVYYNGYLKEIDFGYGGRTQFNYKTGIAGIKSLFSLGIEAQQSFISPKYYTNQPGGRPGTLTNDNEVTAAGYTLFAQGTFDITSKLLVTAGASYNKLSFNVLDLYQPDSIHSSGKKVIDPVISPRIAALYKLADNMAVHASVSYGFAPPENSEIFDPGGVINNIQAEHGINYEAGLRGAVINNKFNFDLVAYNMQLSNEIVSKRDAGSQTIYYNAGATSHKGVELALSYFVINEDRKALSLLKPFANFTFNDFIFKEYINRLVI